VDKNIQNIVLEYKKSIIQSEAEVRSKLLVPLLDVLGYPSYLRAEEFPVYGFEGRKRNHAKDADYVMFSDKHFGEHRDYTKKNIDWVQEHSLLVVEAKKPDEMPEILGQPEYYTVWTKAVAYIACDGIRVKGYFYNNINVDYEVIDCTVEELPDDDSIWNFTYENILHIKEKGIESINQMSFLKSKNDGDEDELEIDGLRLINAKSVDYLSEEELKDFPEDSLRFMRDALGRNANGLSKVQLMSRFLKTTDALLQNNLRYDIPEYIFHFPRNTYISRLYIDDVVLPIESGEITEFYWNEYERFYFEGNYIQIEAIYKNNELADFNMGFHVLDDKVSARLDSFEKVKKILTAKSIRIVLDDDNHRSFVLPCGNPQRMWSDKSYHISMCDFWYAGMKQLKEIETFYEIEFRLNYVTGADNLNKLYDAISFVYDGIMLNENCKISLPGGLIDEDIELTDPLILVEDGDIPLQAREIQGVRFVPYKSCLLPGRIKMKGTKEGDKVIVPGCCLYKIVETEE